MGIVYRSQHVAIEHDLYKIAWIFWIGAIAFAGYFVAVLIAPFIAYLQTFKPIYKVDGFVRYRPPDQRSGEDGQGYVAALFEDLSVACEWEYFGKRALEMRRFPRCWNFLPTRESTRSTVATPACSRMICLCSRSASHPAKAHIQKISGLVIPA